MLNPMLARRHRRAAVGRLHDARAAAGRDDVVAPPVPWCEGAAALRGDAAELAGDPIEFGAPPPRFCSLLLGFGARRRDSGVGLLRRRHAPAAEDDDGRADAPIA